MFTESHDSLQSLTTAANFVGLTYFKGYIVFICVLLLVGVESGRPVSANFQSFVLFSEPS